MRLPNPHREKDAVALVPGSEPRSDRCGDRATCPALGGKPVGNEALHDFSLDFEGIKKYCFFMQSHRLARLLRIIVEIRTHPQKSPEQIAKDQAISIRQFYYDRNQLAEMGFQFSRRKGRFCMLGDPVVTIGDLPLSEVLALVLATRHLFAAKDFSIVWRALNGLLTMVDHMPDPQKRALKSLVEDVIIRDGFGCSPEILEDVLRAIAEKRRILVYSKQRPETSPLSLDPYGLCFRKSKLYVDAYAVERKKRMRYGMTDIHKVVFTLFDRPQSISGEPA